MTDQIAKCPLCAAACDVRERGQDAGADWVAVVCQGCNYSVEAGTFDKVKELHSRIAGKCRWEQKEFCGGYLYYTECGEFNAQWPDTYCPNCGKKVEEVR